MKKLQSLKLGSKLLILVILPVLICTISAISISSIRLKEQGFASLEEKSDAIISRLESARKYIATQDNLEYTVKQVVEEYPDGHLPGEVKDRVMKQVPIFASMAIGAENAAQDNYQFRIASLHPRNKDNTATAKEREFLEEFDRTKSTQSVTYVDKESNSLWVMRPIYINKNQSCLLCHGHPSTSPWGNGLDILEMNMEDWSDNQLMGMFKIVSDIKPVQKQVRSSVLNIIFWGALVVILAIVFSTSIINKITGTIKNVISVNRKIAEGDLREKVPINTHDELGELGIYVNQMVDALTNVIIDVNMASEQISAASDNTSKRSIQLSQGATDQASSVEEVSASMEQMTANIQQNTDNAKITEGIATTSADLIKDGSKSTQVAVAAMNEIAEKIGIINDIAFQTNILALNAAVEAARAGEHGRGFAVVASEVRKLAERSKESAAKISELSKNGVDVAAKAGTQLNDIVPEIIKTADLIREISQSSKEQTIGSNQINEAIQRLNSVTQNNAEIADDLASSAEELSAQASQLKDLISFFKVKK